MAKIIGNVDLSGGQLINVRAETLSTLPTFTAGMEGRVLFVETGPDQGFWFGSASGGNSFERLNLGTVLAEYDITDEAINNGVTFSGTLTAASTAAKVGDVVKVELTSNLSSGLVDIVFYEDSARTVEFYRATFDLAALFVDRTPVFFTVDNDDGDIYVDIVNNTGSNGTFSLSVTAGGRILVNTPPPPGDGSGINDGVAGDGLSYDSVNTRLDVGLTANSGLQLTGSAGDRTLNVFIDPAGHLQRTASGLGAASSVVVTTGDQTVGGIKSFAEVLAIAPAGTSGPPTSGTYPVGALYRDSNQDLWQCVVAGTPGDWVFFGNKEENFGGAANGTSYTGTVSADSSVVLELTMTGRRGWIRKMYIWGSDPARGAVDVDISFRIACYPNENREGREQIWMFPGQLRKTYTSGASAGAAAIPVNDIGLANNDDLVRLRQNAGPLEEYQRVIGRDTGANEIDVDETLVNTLNANDLVMFVVEIIDAPVWNNSATPGNEHKIYLEFFNDDDTADVIFGYEVIFENVGGGVPI